MKLYGQYKFSSIGDVFCWISNGKALLVVFGVPVALILLFNIVALTFTLVSIWKVQKVIFLETRGLPAFTRMLFFKFSVIVIGFCVKSEVQ